MRVEVVVERGRAPEGGQRAAERAELRALVRLKDDHTEEFRELLALELNRAGIARRS